MAVPKHKPSRVWQGKRRSQHKLNLPELTTCRHCGKKKVAHLVCPHCGRE